MIRREVFVGVDILQWWQCTSTPRTSNRYRRHPFSSAFENNDNNNDNNSSCNSNSNNGTKGPRHRKSNSDTGSSSILFLSPTLWPEPDASAAGVRTSSLLNYFASSPNSDEQSLFQNVYYGCGLPVSTDKKPKSTSDFPNVTMYHVPTNRSEFMKQFLNQSEHMKDLKAVVFDRYFAEEAYSFHFYNYRPDVLRILDMQDFHSLRYHRQYMVEQMDKDTKKNGKRCCMKLDYFNDSDLNYMFDYPMVHMNTTMRSDRRNNSNPSSKLLRELASIHRSDLTLVCSQTELDILTKQFGIPKDKLILAPFFTRAVQQCHDDDEDGSKCKTSSFSKRKDFVSIGGFKHAPNVDQVMLLKQSIWPRIRKKLPHARLHIYGAYPTTKIQNLHDEDTGFLVHGHVENLDILKECRVMLAPLRYGAGIKGKIVDAWRYGCPVITTPIGSEGMEIELGDGDDRWGGYICQSTDSFVKDAIDIYTDETKWSTSHQTTKLLLEKLFDEDSNLSRISHAIEDVLMNLNARRQVDYSGSMLWYHSARSTEYFSRWIELKETSCTSSIDVTKSH